MPDLDVAWAEEIRDFTSRARAETADVQTQVDAALLASYALDWALVSWALGEDLVQIRAAVVQAKDALAKVRALRGSSEGLVVTLIEEEGAWDVRDAVDNSLDSDERARLAFHLAALTGADDLDWPGGSAAEDEALAAIESRDADRFLAAVRTILAEDEHSTRDPLSLVSVPAVGLAARAVASGLMKAKDLPCHERLPDDLVLLPSLGSPSATDEEERLRPQSDPPASGPRLSGSGLTGGSSDAGREPAR